MDQNLDNLMKQISQLPETEKNKIFNMLLYQNSAISEKDKETIEFLNASSERLKKWGEKADKLIQKTDEFINDIKKSV